MSSPSKLFSCVQSTAICKSPINNSTAKQQFSFNRTPRFLVPAPYCDAIYNIPNTQTKRATTTGYGKKTDLDYGKHPHNKSPSPDRYQIESFAQMNKTHKIGWTTAIGRELTTPRSYVELDRIKFPGPGRYEQFKHKDSPIWTTRPRTNKQLFDLGTVKIVPGPGNYQFRQSFNPQGKYYVSKFNSSKSKVWNPKSSQRFNKSTTDVPGSGQYNPVNDLSDQGKYVLSKYKGDGKRRQAQSLRNSFVDTPAKITKTPGPGSYRSSSDFGQYDQINILQKSSSVMING